MVGDWDVGWYCVVVGVVVCCCFCGVLFVFGFVVWDCDGCVVCVWFVGCVVGGVVVDCVMVCDWYWCVCCWLDCVVCWVLV